jgi:hypothetical protein
MMPNIHAAGAMADFDAAHIKNFIVNSSSQKTTFPGRRLNAAELIRLIDWMIEVSQQYCSLLEVTQSYGFIVGISPDYHNTPLELAESWSTGALPLEWVLGRVKASASHKDIVSNSNQVGGHLVLTDIKFFSKENVLRTIGEDLVLYLARSYSKNINPLLRTDTMIRLHLVIVAIILHLTTYIACPVGCNLLDHHYHADNRAPQSGCGGRRK